MCLKEALKKLGPFISERRKARIAAVVANRSANISLLLENVNNEANEYAVLRSMEALGCLHLHKLSTVQPQQSHLASCTRPIRPRFPPRTDAGARGWVRIHHWSNAGQCVSHLKEKHGYILAVSNPTAQTSITNLDFSQKLLVAFGNEKIGISEELVRLADVNYSLPMCGFVDSFNVSVAASLTLYHAYLHRSKTSSESTGDLSEREREKCTLQYYMKDLKITSLRDLRGQLEDVEKLEQILLESY